MTEQQQTKLQVATVKLSAIAFQGLRNPETGEYRVAVSQVAELFFPATPQNATKYVKRALGEDSPLLQFHTELNANPANTIDLDQFRKVIRHFDRKGNVMARSMTDVLLNVSLEEFFNDAFGITNTAESRQEIATKTLQQELDKIYADTSLTKAQKDGSVHFNIPVKVWRIDNANR